MHALGIDVVSPAAQGASQPRAGCGSVGTRRASCVAAVSGPTNAIVDDSGRAGGGLRAGFIPIGAHLREDAFAARRCDEDVPVGPYARSRLGCLFQHDEPPAEWASDRNASLGGRHPPIGVSRLAAALEQGVAFETTCGMMSFRHWYAILAAEGQQYRIGPYPTRRTAQRKAKQLFKGASAETVSIVYDTDLKDTRPGRL